MENSTDSLVNQKDWKTLIHIVHLELVESAAEYVFKRNPTPAEVHVLRGSVQSHLPLRICKSDPLLN